MKKKVFLILAAIIVLAAAIPVLAMNDHVIGRGGVWCYTPRFDDEVFLISDYDGDKLFSTTSETGDWTGLFEGTSIDYGIVVFPDAIDPPTVFAGTVVFDEVEVRGTTGALEMDVHGGRQDPFGDWDGTWIITSAEGDLEGLEGHGQWWGPGWLGDPDECGVIYYKAKNIRFP